MTQALDNLTLKLDSEAMNTLMVKAILDAIEPAQREAILAEAIKALTVPQADRFGYSRDKITPLQSAFDQAVRSMAMETARQMVTENTQLVAQVRELVSQALGAMFDASSDLRMKVGDGIGNAVSSWVYDQGRS